MTKSRNRTLLGGLAALLATAALAGRFAGTLTVNGRNSPADIRTINGAAYVRLADVAKALDMVVVSKGNGRYELTKAGGANAIGSLTGKVGETLFDGKWRFSVMSVETPSSYEMKTDASLYNERDAAAMRAGSHTVTPGRNSKLVIVRCRVANGTKERKTLWTAISDERIRTAIADTEGGSHAPVAYDFSGGPTQTDWILPGASMSFNVVFAIPEDSQPKDLIFTLKNNQGDAKGVDVRVSLN